MNNDLIKRNLAIAYAVSGLVRRIDGENWIRISEVKQSLTDVPTAERPQGEYVDISKLRLITVEECAGHTIDYAMGWKACIDWLKKGGAE